MRETLTQLLEQGIANHQAGDLKKAYECYWAILAEDLNSPDALHLSGLLAYQEGRFHIAKELIAKALTFYPHYSVYLNNYGLVLHALKQAEEAIRFYKLALEQDPQYLEAYINLIDILIEKEQYLEALRVFKTSRKLFPTCADLYYLIGLMYIYQRKDKQAIAYLQKVLSFEANHTKALGSLGDLYQEQGLWEEAIRCYEQSFNHPALDNTLKSSLYTSIGYCLTSLGDLTTASQCLEIAFNLSPLYRKGLRTRAKTQYLMSFRLDQRVLPPLPVLEDAEAWDVVMLSCCTLQELGGGQNPAQIAHQLTKLGHRVLYLQNFSGHSAEAPFEVYDDPFLVQQTPPTPYQRQQLMRLIQEFTRTSQNKNRVVLFSIFSPYLLSFIEELKQLGYKMAYWCLDDWQGVEATSFTSDIENQLIAQMDSLFATSSPLAQKLTTIAQKKCPIIPNGFGRDNFPLLADKPPIPNDMQIGQTKTFIYWGNLSASWIDWELLETLAQRHPDWSFNLIGDVKEDIPKAKGGNIAYLGLKPVTELHQYGTHADISFIHFKENKLIDAVNPVKAYEYLACHLPLISTPMPELNHFPYTYQVRNVQEFEEAVLKIEQTPMDLALLEDFLNKSTWEQRAKDFIAALQQ